MGSLFPLPPARGASALHTWYLGSSGCTATATSPSMVSIRVVATTTSSSLSVNRRPHSSALAIPHPPTGQHLDLDTYLSPGPYRRRTRGRQTPPSLCSQAQRAGCDPSAPSYPPVRQVLRVVPRAGTGAGLQVCVGAYLNVRDGRVEGTRPVDQARATVDDSFLMKPHKRLCHSGRQFLGYSGRKS